MNRSNNETSKKNRQKTQNSKNDMENHKVQNICWSFLKKINFTVKFRSKTSKLTFLTANSSSVETKIKGMTYVKRLTRISEVEKENLKLELEF